MATGSVPLSALALLAAFSYHSGLDERELFAQAEKFIYGRPGVARPFLEEILERFPESPLVPETLYRLSLCQGDTFEGRAAALKHLRRLQAEWGDSAAATRPQTIERIEKLSGWKFDRVPRNVLKGTSPRDLLPERRDGPPASITVYRISPRAYRRGLEEAEPPWISEFGPASWKRVVEFGAPSPERWPGPAYISEFDPGNYVLEEEIEGFRLRTPFLVQTFAVVVRALADRTACYAFTPAWGNPLAGIELRVRMRDRVLEATTNEEGLAFLPVISDALVIARHGNEVQACEVHPAGSDRESLVYLTTDRPIYRPGQTVHYRAVHRDRNGGRYSRRPGERVRVEIRDPQGRLLEGAEKTWSAAGTLTGEFRLLESPPLGEYSVVVDVPGPAFINFGGNEDDWRRFWTGTFRVAEYRKPEVQVWTEFAEAAPVRGGKIRARIHAGYYFGGPVANAEVEWSVSESWPPQEAERWPRPPFEDPSAWLYEKQETGDEDRHFGNDLASGTGRTGADGTIEIAFDSPAGTETREYLVQATVTDLSRLQAHGESRIRALPAAVQVRVGTERMFYREGERLTALARVTTAGGKPSAGTAVQLTALRAVARGREIEFESFLSERVMAGADGLASLEVPLPRSGRIRLLARVVDGGGRVAEDRADLWVAGEGAVLADEEDRTRNDVIDIVPDRLVYRAGETIRLLVRSPVSPLTALLLIEGERLHDARPVEISNGCQVLEIPARGDFTPNVYLLLNGWLQGRTLSGGCEVFVDRSPLELQVTADRPAYQPGEAMTVTVTTRSQGEPVAAELELGIVDESIFALTGDRTPDIRAFFTRMQEGISSISATYDAGFGYQTWRWRPRSEAGGSVAFFAGAGEEDESAGFAPAVLRRSFPDTLYWSGQVETGPEGRAVIRLPAPDQLTAWRLTARAVSGEDRFGSSRSSTLTTREVVVRISAPRFYTERDEGTVSTIVRNGLALETEFTVRLSAQGSPVGPERTMKIAAGGEARLDWKLPPARPGRLRLRAEALSAAGSDRVEIELPVRPHGAEHPQVATGRVQGSWTGSLALAEEIAPGTASLEVTATSAGTGAILEALPFLAGYPYGCVEQTMSRFLPSLVAAGTLRRLGTANPELEKALPEMVAQGIQRLYRFQHQDGGWGWWTDDETHPFMTAYVVFGLATARRAGFAVDPETLKKGLEKLEKLDPTPFALYARAVAGTDVSGPLGGAEPANLEERAYLVLAGRRDLARDLSGQPPWATEAEDIRVASLMVRALHAADARDPRIAPLVEWLMLKRRGNAWASTLDSAYAVYALSDLAVARKEPAVRLLVNGEEVAAHLGRTVVAGARLKTGPNAIEVRQSGEGLVFVSARLDGRTSAERLAGSQGALRVTRRFERARLRPGEEDEEWEEVRSGERVKVGDGLRVVLEVKSDDRLPYVLVESPIPAGSEASEERGDYGEWRSRCGDLQARDDRVALAVEELEAGGREFDFYLRATHPGEYHVMPAVAFAMYDPDRRGSSDEFILKVVGD